MNEKKLSRLRRAKKTRLKIKELRINRLCVNRTPRHIYAQITTPDGSAILAAASTLDKEVGTGATGNVAAASRVGGMIAERAKAAGISKVAFDRSGYKFHGRIKALAEAARENGLEF